MTLNDSQETLTPNIAPPQALTMLGWIQAQLDATGELTVSDWNEYVRKWT